MSTIAPAALAVETLLSEKQDLKPDPPPSLKPSADKPYHKMAKPSVDLEAQSPSGPKILPIPRSSTPNNHTQPQSYPEYEVRTSVKMLHVTGWFMLNLLLTIYNKAVLEGFNYPWLLTAVHTGVTSLGCTVFLQRRRFKFTVLNRRDHIILLAFSLLFTINIALSNVSLALVSVPFHQVMRSTAPIYTVFLQWIFSGRYYSAATYLSLIPVILGVAMTTSGDYDFTPFGFCLTLFGVVISVIKTLIGNSLMTGSLSMPTLEVLVRLSPLAAIQCIGYAIVTGELSSFLEFRADGHLTHALAFALFGNGVIAFLLNISSFQTNKLAGALTLSIAGNLKQCLTILLGIVFFHVQVNLVGGLGMLISLAGAAWYSKVELDSKGRK